MRNRIPFYNNIPKRELMDCRITTLRDIMRFYGLGVDSFSLYLLSRSYGFSFGKMIFDEAKSIDIWVAGTSDFNIVENLMKTMKFECNIFKVGSNSDGINKFVDAIDRGIPLLTLYDSRYVLLDNYKNSGFRILDMYNLSLATVAGYDTECREFEITLNNTDDKTDLFRVKMDKFMMARCCETYPVKPNNRCYEIKLTDSYINDFKIRYIDLLKNEIISLSENMICGNTINTEVFNTRVLSSQSGVKAISMLLNEIREFIINFQNDYENANKSFIIKFTVLRNMLSQGSYTCYREEFGRSLKHFGTTVNNKRIICIGEEFMEIGLLWRRFMRILFNISNYVMKKNELLDLIEKIIPKIIAKEEKNYLKLLHILK